MAGGRVEVINSKGCSKLILEFSSSLPSFRSLKSFEPMSPASSVGSKAMVGSSGPFSGLVICVTGLSKEARKQVQAATERLGGQYSPNLHPQCTHLVVQISCHCKLYYHALKHGLRNGLFVVTLGWFVDSVRRNVRLSESLYTVKSVGENGVQLDFNRLVGSTGTEKSCLPVGVHEATKQSKITERPLLQLSGKESSRSRELVLAGQTIHVDSDLSPELKRKVADAASREGATFLDHWFVGCGATHIVCEGPSIQRYLGHTNNLVTPLWILKTAKEKSAQRLVQLSADLAKQVSMMLENFQNGVAGQETNGIGGLQSAVNARESPADRISRENPEERQQIVNLAKTGVRNRRGRRMQTCQTPIRPITPNSLLDSICWSISEPTSAACIYTDSSGLEDANEQHTSVFFDARGEGRDSEATFENFSRRLRESEKAEMIFKNHFLTILFPIDRFGEMGPSSRSFFSDKGFTCLQVLDHIYAFYQENMSEYEVNAAIHTDSRHADRLRSIYASQTSLENGYVQFKRIDFLGSRRSFEMLKRIGGDNNSNVYELLIRA
ncbi:BRCT domain [Macleaya cordata]|uniref:BRCT domain n=1 Tax=Macleaya cordata TaxID=56857 RepID=A0A200Q195_MACCD|nr:BRCT domain [Macleaya cordata]